MLAQNFKTPADLEITEVEFEAFVKTLGVIERGEIRHVWTKDDLFTEGNDFEYVAKKFDALFNMDNVYTRADCGTAACIAGTCDLLFKTRFAPTGNLRSNLSEPLMNLFCPNDVNWNCWPSITVEQAAIALRNYLTYGEPRWAEALAD